MKLRAQLRSLSGKINRTEEEKMNMNKFIILTFFLLFQIPIIHAQISKEKEQKLIIGSWREENSKKIRYLFKPNGTGVEYLGDYIDSFTYSFVTNFKDCDSSMSGTAEENHYFLKIKSKAEALCECYLVNGLTDKTLSLSPFASGGFTLFYRMKKNREIRK